MLIFTFVVVFSTFLGNSYLNVSDYIVDIFIPYTIGYAIKNDSILHETFHTSFGFIYGILNFISLKVIDWFKMFETSDLIMLSSVIFSIVVLFSFFGTKLTFNSKIEPVPYWILLVALPLVFQLRDIDNFDLKDIVWYGTYNHHLWGLFIIQVASVFCLEKFYRKSWKEGHHLTFKSLFGFSFMQALFSFIGLNYKLNFFIASFFVSFGLFFMMSAKTRFFYVSLIIVFLGLFCGIVSSLGYNYGSYFFDIYQAIESQIQPSNGSSKYKELLVFSFLYVIISTSYRLGLVSSKDLEINFLKLKSLLNHVLKKVSFKDFFFDLCVAGGLFFASYGSTSKPIVVFLIVSSIFILINSKGRNIIFLSSGFLILFYIVNVFSLLRVTQYKFYDNRKRDYILRTIDASQEPMAFVVKNHPGISYILKFFMINDEYKKDHSQDVKNFKKLSYSYMPREKMDFFKNSDYIRMMSDAVLSFKNVGVVKEDKVTMLGFINPLPFLLNTSLPSPTYHWIDKGINFSFKNIYKLERSFKDSDFVFMPILEFHEITQTILNCQFYVWNFKYDESFKIFKMNQYGVYFASQEKMKEYHLNEVSKTDDREEIIYVCNRLSGLD